MTIADRAVLVTGANRGIGQALVAEALRTGARRVYAGTRQPLAHPDVTNQAQILPLLTRSRGAVVNNLSLMALAAVPLTPAYSASRAAALSPTQSLRALLAGRGVRVHAVLTGPTRDDPGPRHPQGLCGIGRASHPRRSGERRGGDLPRSHVRDHKQGDGRSLGAVARPTGSGTNSNKGDTTR